MIWVLIALMTGAAVLAVLWPLSRRAVRGTQAAPRLPDLNGKVVAELWDVGENLDKACEACHRSYWYPGEGAEFYRKLRQRLEDLHK